jgi:hypothetical protein
MESPSVQRMTTRDSSNMEKEKDMGLRNIQMDQSSSVSSRMIWIMVMEYWHAQMERYIEGNSEITGGKDTDTWNTAIMIIMMVNGKMG